MTARYVIWRGDSMHLSKSHQRSHYSPQAHGQHRWWPCSSRPLRLFMYSLVNSALLHGVRFFRLSYSAIVFLLLELAVASRFAYAHGILFNPAILVIAGVISALFYQKTGRITKGNWKWTGQ